MSIQVSHNEFSDVTPLNSPPLAAKIELKRHVVFACKSNSCRSQMAEGWARDWVARMRRTTTGAEHEKLDSFAFSSVALDSSAVFENSKEQCCGDECNTVGERKAVKEKAVQAMAREGIDISKGYPKTWKEIESCIVKPRLVIVCDCGIDNNDVKGDLLTVEKWNIDAPSAACKAGEGDDAYGRVSRQIKNQVDAYLDNLYSFF